MKGECARAFPLQRIGLVSANGSGFARLVAVMA